MHNDPKVLAIASLLQNELEKTHEMKRLSTDCPTSHYTRSLRRQTASIHPPTETLDSDRSRGPPNAPPSGMESSPTAYTAHRDRSIVFIRWFGSVRAFLELLGWCTEESLFSATVLSCVRYSTLFFKHADATCKAFSSLPSTELMQCTHTRYPRYSDCLDNHRM